MNILSSLLLHIILLIFFSSFFCCPFLLALLLFSCYYCFRAFPHFFQAHLLFPLQHFLQRSHFHLDHRDRVCHRAQLELFLLLLALLLFSFYYCFGVFPHFFQAHLPYPIPHILQRSHFHLNHHARVCHWSQLELFLPH